MYVCVCETINAINITNKKFEYFQWNGIYRPTN